MPKQKIIRGILDKNLDTIGGLSDFLGLLIYSDNAPLLFSKGRSASPLPLRPAPVLATVYAGSSYASVKNAPTDFGRSEVAVLKFFNG